MSSLFSSEALTRFVWAWPSSVLSSQDLLEHLPPPSDYTPDAKPSAATAMPPATSLPPPSNGGFRNGSTVRELAASYEKAGPTRADGYQPLEA